MVQDKDCSVGRRKKREPSGPGTERSGDGGDGSRRRKKERFIQFEWIWIEAPRVKSMDDERWMM